MRRFLILTKGYDPEKQLKTLEEIGIVEDHWMEGEDSSEPVNKNEAKIKTFKSVFGSGVLVKEEVKDEKDNVVLTIEHRVPRGLYVVRSVNKEFLDDYGFLDRNYIKELLLDFDDCRHLGKKIEVYDDEKKRIGWIHTGFDYGVMASHEKGVIYRGKTSCAIGTEKSSITVLEE